MGRNGKLTQGLIVEAHQKLDEMARALNEADSSRKKLQVENQDLIRQIEETENAIAALGKNKISLTTQLEDTKRMRRNLMPLRPFPRPRLSASCGGPSMRPRVLA